ncbi:spore germination protein [Paenibacillus thalictri]|uniref:Spore germination protein n=1 Tax=Paenibacillus thalictri TaxID=2527873 RepID=A0A4Q9DJ68_9BACL|nr:spore germination protein [Paenibacillus thalictri]TBL70503.1 spore germination protein [Paenibacillus thalictri]
MTERRERLQAWTRQDLEELFAGCSDVQILSYRFGEESSSEVYVIYAEGLCNSGKIGTDIMPVLQQLYVDKGFESSAQWKLFGSLPVIQFHGIPESQDIIDSVFQGDLLLLFAENLQLLKLNICNRPGRQPEESSTEISIKGPKDGFVEDISTSIALIRKRLRSNSLQAEMSVIGRRTRTKVALLYIRDIIAPDIVKEVRKRLGKIDIDGLYTTNQLEEALADVKYSLFPMLDFTGRPDYAVSSLLAGRFVLIIDGNPFVLIGPAGLSLLLKSPEDVHFGFMYISFARMVRFLSFWAAIILPGFWVAISAFHQDQFPFRLMATISLARLGLPLSSQLEMLLLLVLLEIFREAGLRLPNSIGQTLTVVGGLVIGDAAIRAGLVSPSVVVIGAITAVMGVTLVNQTLSTSVSIARFIMFLLASVLGMYGVILGFILLIFYMSRLHSFGVPYFGPISPPIFSDMAKSYLRVPWEFLKSRPKAIHPVDPDHQGEDNG